MAIRWQFDYWSFISCFYQEMSPFFLSFISVWILLILNKWSRYPMWAWSVYLLKIKIKAWSRDINLKRFDFWQHFLTYFCKRMQERRKRYNVFGYFCLKLFAFEIFSLKQFQFLNVLLNIHFHFLIKMNNFKVLRFLVVIYLEIFRNN